MTPEKREVLTKERAKVDDFVKQMKGEDISTPALEPKHTKRFNRLREYVDFNNDQQIPIQVTVSVELKNKLTQIKTDRKKSYNYIVCEAINLCTIFPKVYDTKNKQKTFLSLRLTRALKDKIDDYWRSQEHGNMQTQNSLIVGIVTEYANNYDLKD